jgi:hypothetical protein
MDHNMLLTRGPDLWKLGRCRCGNTRADNAKDQIRAHFARGGFAWQWHFQGDKAGGTAPSASAAFLAAGARAGWPPPEEWPHPGEQYDGELAELDLFLNALSYRERELWVEKTETGWRARVKERGSILWTAEESTPGLSVLEVGRKALDQDSTARFI